MPLLRNVWFWPNGGVGDLPWSPSGSAAEDAFVRTSRRVTERYSEMLGGSGIEARRSAIQMLVTDTGDSRSGAWLELHLNPAGQEIARAFVPPGVAEMPPQERARLVLEMVDTAMTGIGLERGWPQEALERARRHTLGDDVDFEMLGPWRTNPSRRRRVRPVVRIADDGWGDWGFEVTDSTSGTRLGFTRTVRSPINSTPKFKRSTRDSRWVDDRTLERPDDWVGRLGSERGPVETFDIDDLRSWPRARVPMPTRSPVVVEVRVR